MTTEIDAIFAADGPLAKAAGDAYEVRDGQIEMANAVMRNFTDGCSLFVEAGTGTGKTRAYLVPAMLVASALGKRTVVVTANIALQEQLIAKDLPALCAALPHLNVAYALAKGIGNYVCRERWQDAFAESLMSSDRAGWKMIEEWVSTTSTGDLSELKIELDSRKRAAITTTADDCIGRKCPHYEQCFGMMARKAVREAQIVVTNYHLFFADLALRMSNPDTKGILPNYDYVVLDEAHNAADISRDFFGWRISFGQVRWATRMLSQSDQAAILPIAEAYFARVGAGDGPRGQRVKMRIRNEREIDGAALAAKLLEAQKKLDEKAGLELERVAKAKLMKCSDRAGEVAARIEQLDSLVNRDNNVYFAVPPSHPNGYWSVQMRPIDVSEILGPALFESQTISAIVATSATLTANGKFDFILNQLGAVGSDCLSVPSPFDHHGRAVLVVPRDLPDPKHSLFIERVSEVVDETVRAARGRTLALFTSYRVMDAAYQHLMSMQHPYRILKQGDMPRTKLIAEFRSDVTSVLLGTDSFWEGIDVQGESLSAVVMDRLPFERPDDPIVEAIAERDPRGWFAHYLLPKSVITFRQGFGRLIRSQQDRGAIIVCDKRIIDKPYGRQYTRSLPDGVTLERAIDAVAEILR